MDVNNKIGQSIGSKYYYATKDIIAKQVLEALTNGELVILKKRPKNQKKSKAEHERLDKNVYK